MLVKISVRKKCGVLVEVKNDVKCGKLVDLVLDSVKVVW